MLSHVKKFRRPIDQRRRNAVEEWIAGPIRGLPATAGYILFTRLSVTEHYRIESYRARAIEMADKGDRRAISFGRHRGGKVNTRLFG